MNLLETDTRAITGGAGEREGSVVIQTKEG
jgi:hypothetical protein